MKKWIVIAWVIPFHFVWADDSLIWTCTAFDHDKQQWQFTHNYKRVAINKALAECKKESKLPVSCQVIKSNCNYVGETNSETAINEDTIWQCTALDFLAKSWPNEEPAYSKYDAAIAAKQYCKDKSSVPETCYINLLTCKTKL